MKVVFSFLAGVILGAVSLFLYLDQSGQVKMRPRVSPGPSFSSRQAVAATVASPDRAPSRAPASQVPATGGSGTGAVLPPPPRPIAPELPQLIVPVLGVDRSKLHDMYADRRGGGRTHEAIDIMAPRGTPVIAVASGTVRKLFTSKAGGLTIYQYNDEETLIYYYAHLDRYETGLDEGDRIDQGQTIGYVGSTGNANPAGPHLHFAVMILPPTKEWWKGTAVNPYPLLRGEVP